MTRTLQPADVRLFEQDGRTYAFLPSSFAVIEIDPLFRDVLRLGHLKPREVRQALAPRYSGKAIDEALAEVESLFRRELVRPPRRRPPRKAGFEVQSLLLMVTNACNFSCTYCHGDHEKLPQQPMAERTARAAVDLLVDRSGEARKLTIYFFGGEPLLNFEVVRATVAYARERAAARDKQIDFGMTTNGYLLDADKAAFLHEYRFSPLFSMDGPAEVQNQCRQLRGGQDTFDQVYANVKHYLELGGPCSVRATVTPSHIDLVGLTEFFYQVGFRAVSLEPVASTSTPPDPRFVLDWSELQRSYSALAERTLERLTSGEIRRNLLHGLLERIDRGSGHTKPCYVGEENLTVTAEGDIYPCYRFIGKPGFRMGSVWDGVDLEVSRRFEEQNTIFASEQCDECWARYVCGGQCPADRLERNGDLTMPVVEKCALQRHLIDLALRLYVRIRGDRNLSESLFDKPAHRSLMPDPACV